MKTNKIKVSLTLNNWTKSKKYLRSRTEMIQTNRITRDKYTGWYDQTGDTTGDDGPTGSTDNTTGIESGDPDDFNIGGLQHDAEQEYA